MAQKKRAQYGSDVIVNLLKAFQIEYTALNPGSSFRGIHDSIVNYGGNKSPEAILCCHEEIAVSMAYGYAKASGKPMVAIVHNLVGLLHATMGTYNAWTSRVPVILMGGTGPMDETKRRSGIDWVHTALVQGKQVRDYVKWDDQPSSVRSFPESFIRAYRLATTRPQGPVYLCYDVTLQEEALKGNFPLPDLERYPAPFPVQASEDAFEKFIRLLLESDRPVIIAEQAASTEGVFNALVELAELLAAPVLDRGGRLNFPSLHPLNLTGHEKAVLSRADLVLAFDVANLYGATRGIPAKAKISHVHLNDLLVRSWSQDYDKLAEMDLSILADTRVFLPELLRRLREEKKGLEKLKEGKTRRTEEIDKLRTELAKGIREEARSQWNKKPIASMRLFSEMAEVLKKEDWVLTNGSSGSKERHFLDCRRFNQFLGGRRFGGVGNGLPSSIGAALALKGTGKVLVGIQPDGDFLFNPSALWTAAHYEIPLLMVVYNNRSYYNDEEHQRIIAVQRKRPVENKTVAIRIEQPGVNFARLAEGYDVKGFGPVTDPKQVRQMLNKGLRYVKDRGKPAVVDVVMQNR